MVKVMVTDDGKKIFEEEGKLFVGAMLHNEGTKHSACSYGNAKMIDILALLMAQAIRTLKVASDNQVEYIASIASLSKALRDFTQKEFKRTLDETVKDVDEE